MKLAALIILSVLVGVAASQRGEAGTVGSLEGNVRAKDSREPLVGANVAIVGTVLGASSDAQGFYSVRNIPAGTYDVRCSFIGRQTVVMRGVRVLVDVKTLLDIELPPSTVELEVVEVTAGRPPIQKDVTGTLYTSSGETFKALPIADVGDFIGVQPGVTFENNIRGGKTTEVVYLVDGLPVQNLIEGGAGGELPQSSIGEMAVQTGGFDPEYGNALSGVVNIVTRRGTEEFHLGVRAEKDDIFGVEQVDHRNELDLTVSGPVTRDLFYFAGVDATLSDTRWWQDMQHFFSSPYSTSYNGLAKLDYSVSEGLRLSGQVLYSKKNWHDYEYSWRFNLAGLPPRSEESYRLAAIVSHTVSPSFFYTVSLSRYQLNSGIGTSASDVDTTLYQYDFFLRYVVSGNRSWWADKQQINNLIKADFTWRPDEHHLLKAGMELNLQEIYSDVIRYEPWVNVFGKPFVNKPLLNYGSDFHYFPRSGSAYIQDKLELSKDGMLLNVGFRYDFLDPRAERPIAERTPDASGEYQTTITGTVPASVKQYISPRIGFAAPFAARGYLFINYGRYYQFPLFDYLYSGLNNVSLKRGVGVLVGNPDLKAEDTRAWEMSIKYALKNGVVLSGTYFHKETSNQIDVKTFVPTNSLVAGDYGFAEFVNNPVARATGLELSVAKEGGHPLSGSVSYTLMYAEGVSEDSRDGLEYYEWGIQVPARPFPLSWDQRHTVKVIGLLELPFQMSLSVLWMYHSGRPYTYYPSKDGFTPIDPSMEFEPNNARMSDYNVLNAKLSKDFALGSGDPPAVKLIVYADSRNLLNAKNVRWVDSSGRPGGELGDLSGWDPGRRIRIGVRLEY